MGLLERLVGIGFPSSNWQEDPYRRLELDLTERTLCGVPLGAPMDELAFLGVAEDSRLAHRGKLFYFRKGLIVTVAAARTSGYSAVFEPPGEGDPESVRPFAGVVLLEGRVLALDSSTTLADIEALFGPPHARHDYEEGPELTYEDGASVMDVKLNLQGGLASLYLGLTTGLDPIRPR